MFTEELKLTSERLVLNTVCGLSCGGITGPASVLLQVATRVHIRTRLLAFSSFLTYIQTTGDVNKHNALTLSVL